MRTPRLRKVAADPDLQSRGQQPLTWLQQAVTTATALLPGPDYSPLFTADTPAALPHVNEPSRTMGPVALLGSAGSSGAFGAVTLVLSSPFFLSPLDNQLGDGNEGGRSLAVEVGACLYLTEPPPGMSPHVLTRGWQDLKPFLILSRC